MTRDAFVRSRAAFDRYCAMGSGQLPEDPISRRQVELCREDPPHLLNDVAEALTGLADVAKFSSIHDLENPLDDPNLRRSAVADAMLRTIEGLMNIATAYRLDFGELCRPEREPEGERVRCRFCHHPHVQGKPCLAAMGDSVACACSR